MLVDGAGCRSCSIFADAAEDLATAPHLGDDLLLHKIEAHGNKGHADDQIHGAKNKAELDATGTVERVAGHVVTESSRAQRNETKVGALEEVPILPLTEEHGTTAHITDHHCQTDGDGHRCRLVIDTGRFIVVVDDVVRRYGGAVTVVRPSAGVVERNPLMDDGRDGGRRCCHGRSATVPPASRRKVAFAQFHVAPTEAGGQHVAHIGYVEQEQRHTHHSIQDRHQFADTRVWCYVSVTLTVRAQKEHR